MNDQELKEEFEKIWAKVKELEKKISPAPEMPQSKGSKTKKKGVEGLAGGIRFLIDEGFLNNPKTVNEIHQELKREGYHYPKGSVDKLLRVNFHKKNRVLNRVKKNKVWTYVVRK